MTAPADVRLRVYRHPDDYQAVIALWRACGPGVQVRRSDEQDEIAKKISRDPDLFLLAECGGRIVGTVLGGFDGRRGMVYHLAVAADFRKQGIASLLMEELENRLRARGCLRSYLLVTRENAEAMGFYEKRGWERMDLYVYGKDLQ